MADAGIGETAAIGATEAGKGAAEAGAAMTAGELGMSVGAPALAGEVGMSVGAPALAGEIGMSTGAAALGGTEAATGGLMGGAESAALPFSATPADITAMASGGGAPMSVGAPATAGTGAVTGGATGAASGTAGGSSLMSSLTSGATPYLAGAGLLSSFLGKQQQAGQQKENLSDYLANTTWTPAKAGAYTAGVNANTAGTVGRAGARAKGTLAEQLASSGRGGGSYGAQAQGIDEQTLNALGAGRNQALATVSTPPNLSAAPFMGQTSPSGETLSGLGGMFGNMATMNNTAELLKRMGLFGAKA